MLMLMADDIICKNIWYSFFQHINAKQLRMLKFENPGRFMEDFDPERSTREMRKVNRRIYRETYVTPKYTVITHTLGSFPKIS